MDASPLIVLAQSGLLHLLQVAGQRVVVPTAVVAEVQQYGADNPTVRALATTDWLETVEVGSVDARVSAFGLGAGESEVLTWTLTHPGAEALLDDLRARRAAGALGIPTRGVLGLILTAKHRGLIAAARPVIEHLLSVTDWYLSDRERDRALRRVGE